MSELLDRWLDDCEAELGQVGQLEDGGTEYHFTELPNGAQVFEFWRGGKKISGGIGAPWSEQSLGDRLRANRGRWPELTPPDPEVAPTEGW